MKIFYELCYSAAQAKAKVVRTMSGEAKPDAVFYFGKVANAERDIEFKKEILCDSSELVLYRKNGKKWVKSL